ncbi:hypothetical protein ACHAQH_001617 [Verticillium albo-atrum]
MESAPSQVPPDGLLLAAQTDRVDAKKALTYWSDIKSDDSGMLGGIPDLDGFAHVSKVDLQGSRSFLAKLGIGQKNSRHTLQNVLESGAGIGRVTEGLLLSIANEVDVVEPVAKFTAALQEKKGVRLIENISMSAWRPKEGVFYDLVWIQWCLGYLSDDLVVEHLRYCRMALRADKSLIVVKENINSAVGDLFDAADGSVTRHVDLEDDKFRRLFREAGLRVVKMELQKGMKPSPTGKKLLPIKMYALKPS